jgi:hypothetical protein
MSIRSAFSTAAFFVTAPMLCVSNVTRAQNAGTAPTYSRTRMGADDGQSRGGHGWNRGNGNYGYGGGFYQPYYAGVFSNSWYERPYPYHFDYYKYRWGANHLIGGAQAAAGNADCPCAAGGPEMNKPSEAPMPPAPAPGLENKAT